MKSARLHGTPSSSLFSHPIVLILMVCVASYSLAARSESSSIIGGGIDAEPINSLRDESAHDLDATGSPSPPDTPPFRATLKQTTGLQYTSSTSDSTVEVSPSPTSSKTAPTGHRTKDAHMPRRLVPAAGPTNTFWHLTDVHYDPLYQESKTPVHFCRGSAFPKNMTSCGTKKFSQKKGYDYSYGQYGCDSPASLIDSTLAYMRSTQPNPDFIVYTGDFAAHCSPSLNFTLNATQWVVDKIVQYFNNTPVIPVLGNNDVFPHNQLDPDPNNPVLSAYADMWGRAKWLDEGAQETFRKGGYFAATPVSGVRIISFNSIYYSTDWCGTLTSCADPSPSSSSSSSLYPSESSDLTADSYTAPLRTMSKWIRKLRQSRRVTQEKDLPSPRRARVRRALRSALDIADQFAWLADQMDEAEEKNERVYIATHYGPILSRGANHLFTDAYQQAFYTAVDSPALGSIIMGHLHRSTFTLMNSTGLFLVAPAVTPRAKNNPAVRLVNYESTEFTLTDYTDHYFDLKTFQKSGDSAPTWMPGYSFDSTYAVTSPTRDQVTQVYQSLQVNSSMLAAYNKMYDSNSTVGSYDDRNVTLCRVGTFFYSDADACLEGGPDNNSGGTDGTETENSGSGSGGGDTTDDIPTAAIGTGTGNTSAIPSSTSNGHPTRDIFMAFLFGVIGTVVVVTAIVLGSIWGRRRRRAMLQDMVVVDFDEIDSDDNSDVSLPSYGSSENLRLL